MTPRKAPTPPPIESKDFTLEEIERGIAKLQRRVPEIEALNAVTAADPGDASREILASTIRGTIRDVFGPGSPEFDEHQYLDIWAGNTRMGMQRDERAMCIESGKARAIGILRGMIGRLEEKREDLGGSKEDRVRTAFRGLELHPRIADVATDLYLDEIGRAA